MRINHSFQPYAATLLVSFTAAALFGCSPGASDSNSSESTDKLFTVRKSDLIIGSLLRGTANAKKMHKLFPEASYKNTLTWIADENSHVKKGDVVIRFETRDLLDDIEARKLNIESQQKTLDIRNEEKRVILSDNQSNLRVAADAVESADEAYARYYKYDGKKKKEDLEADLVLIERAFTDAQTKYLNKLDEISNTIYEKERARQKALSDLEKLKNEMEKKERAFKNAAYALKIFKRYTYPNTLTDKKNKLQQAQLNLQRTQVSTASKVVQKENEIIKIENALRKDRQELERRESYLPMMEIKAPEDGILVYGNVEGRRDRNIEIELGMEVKRNRVIATIPEMDNLIVKFELPEQFRHRIDVGAKAIITPDSMPGVKVSGIVDKIAVVPVNQIHWDRTSPKVYHASITLDQQDENFVSGMNVVIEVVEETLEQALNIPVEAVFEEEGDFFVYLKTGTKPRKRVVELGKSNDKYVHITKGLKENDNVYLFSPYELEASE